MYAGVCEGIDVHTGFNTNSHQLTIDRSGRLMFNKFCQQTMPLPSEFGCESVFFFASFEDVISIMLHGQYSRKNIEKFTRNGSLDWKDSALKPNLIRKRRSYSNYISLYFGTHTPTQEAVEKKNVIAFVRYNSDKLFQLTGAKFSNYALQVVHDWSDGGLWDCNTQSNNLAKLNWDILLKKRSEQWFVHPPNVFGFGPAKQSELLIPEYLSGELIEEIVLFSDRDYNMFMEQYLQRRKKLPSLFLDHPPNLSDVSSRVTIQPNLFFKSYCNVCEDGDDVIPYMSEGGFCEHCQHALRLNGDCATLECSTCGVD